MTDNGSGIFQSRHQPCKECALSSENDPLDFSSINNHTQGTYLIEPYLGSSCLALTMYQRVLLDIIQRFHPLQSVFGYSKDPMVYDVQTFLWKLWGLLFKIVQMIPYNHPKQERYIQVYGKANSKF